jgi:hypothetical protein
VSTREVTSPRSTHPGVRTPHARDSWPQSLGRVHRHRRHTTDTTVSPRKKVTWIIGTSSRTFRLCWGSKRSCVLFSSSWALVVYLRIDRTTHTQGLQSLAKKVLDTAAGHVEERGIPRRPDVVHHQCLAYVLPTTTSNATHDTDQEQARRRGSEEWRYCNALFATACMQVGRHHTSLYLPWRQRRGWVYR